MNYQEEPKLHISKKKYLLNKCSQSKLGDELRIEPLYFKDFLIFELLIYYHPLPQCTSRMCLVQNLYHVGCPKSYISTVNCLTRIVQGLQLKYFSKLLMQLKSLFKLSKQSIGQLFGLLGSQSFYLLLLHTTFLALCAKINTVELSFVKSDSK